MAKVLEKGAVNQLTAVLEGYNMFDKFQSGFHHLHSTETALLRVFNDLLMQGDAGECSVLVLLDLTAAFDTVDHCILVERLRQYVGISGTTLKWFSPYLSDGSFSVRVHNYSSSTASLSSGVPQGSVFGPAAFALLPLGQLVSTFQGICYHCYADDIQLYISLSSM